MAEQRTKRNYWAVIGIILGVLSTFLLGRPVLTPIMGAAAMVISIAGIYEARKTEDGLAYATVGFILGMFVLVYHFYMGG
jgi:uncharacterized membrane protein YgaE (UPF0421/DUF939 family)